MYSLDHEDPNCSPKKFFEFGADQLVAEIYYSCRNIVPKIGPKKLVLLGFSIGCCSIHGAHTSPDKEVRDFMKAHTECIIYIGPMIFPGNCQVHKPQYYEACTVERAAKVMKRADELGT